MRSASSCTPWHILIHPIRDIAASCSCRAIRYSEAILHNPGGPYDRAWMEWAAAPWLTGVAHPAARCTTTVLDPPPAMQELMLAAQHDPTLADAFADTFTRPANMARFAGSPS